MMTRGRMTTGVALLILVTSSCGGGSQAETSITPDSTTQGEPSVASTTSQPTNDATQQSEAAPSTISQDESIADSDHPRTDVSHATVVIGGEVFNYAQLNENGTCNPSFLGIQFKATLTRIDDQGEAMPIEGMGDILAVQNVTFGFTDVGPEEGVVAMLDDWMAATAFERGSVDTVTIDGNTARGTATFVDPDGTNTVEGTFEVVCVG